MISRQLPLAVVAGALFFASEAAGTPVTVSGGFDAYSGMVFACTHTSTFVGDGGDTFSTTVGLNPPCTVQSPAFQKQPTALTFDVSSELEFFSTFNTGGDLVHNSLIFTPAPPQEVSGPGVPFLLGTLTFENGIWAGFAADDPPTLFHLTLQTSSSNGALDGHILSTYIQLGQNVNSPGLPPEEIADYIYFQSFTGLGSFRVYELDGSHSNIGTVDLYGQIGSLTPTLFINPQGSGFLDPGVSPALTTPEPGTLLLVSGGLAALIRRRARGRPRNRERV